MQVKALKLNCTKNIKQTADKMLMSQTDKKHSQKSSKTMKKSNLQSNQDFNENNAALSYEKMNNQYQKPNPKQKICQQTNKLCADDEKISNQCLVCIDEIQDECILNPCQHKYCYPCIFDWMKQKQRCPLCNIEVVEIIKTNQNAETDNLITKVSDIADSVALESLKANSLPQNDHVERFECLDHNYLKNEVEKLLSKLDFVQRKMEQQSNKYDDYNWFIIDTIDDQIYELENIVEEFIEFNPQEIAQKCFLLEEHLDIIRNNKWEMIEEHYSDLYAFQLQKEEEEIQNYNQGNSKSKNSSNKNKKSQAYNKNGNSKSHISEFEDDFYYDDSDISSFPSDFKDYSIKNFKPKAPKKKFNNTIPLNMATSMTKI
ncbi:hypothetical protein ABPG72_011257 [Tetrahymena utriculariae]